MSRSEVSLHARAALQADVVSRAQLRNCGYADRYLTRRVSNGPWRALGPRVVVLHRGPLGSLARMWVAVLHGGPTSALGTWSAAEAEGLAGYEVPELTLAVPHGSQLQDLAHELITVRVRQTRHLDAAVHPVREPPRVRLAVALVEAVAGTRSTDQLRAALAAAVQQRLVTAAALRDAAMARRTLPQRAMILATIEDIAGGAHSLPELQYARALRRAGLPAPTRQRKIQRPGGSWYLDNDFDPWPVTVEVNGAQHLDLRAREYDDARRQALQQTGRIVVDLSSYVIHARPHEAVLRTASALLTKGWCPAPRVRRGLDAAAASSKWTGWNAA